MAAAIKLFEIGRLSSGAAAELAGLPLIAFISKLGEFGTETFKQTLPEIADDSANA
jgi:predicted HTH domain antitoxin